MKPGLRLMIVEDTPEDHEMTVRALKKVGVASEVIACSDGDDALDYLYRRGKYKNAANCVRPALILLDLNLPGTDGREVLAHIKRDRLLRSIPVIVLSTSADYRDVVTCYQHGANSFIKKPLGFANLVTTMQRLKDYWLETVILEEDSP